MKSKLLRLAFAIVNALITTSILFVVFLLYLWSPIATVRSVATCLLTICVLYLVFGAKR